MEARIRIRETRKVDSLINFLPRNYIFKTQDSGIYQMETIPLNLIV